MIRYPDGTYRQSPPASVDHDGYIRPFYSLSREQWDELGYNEAVRCKREPHTTYVTQWVKCEDLIYREVVVSSTLDEETRLAEAKEAMRARIRDRAQAFLDDVAQKEYPQWEIATWTDQETEARAYLQDSATATPTLDGICSACGMDKDELVGRVIANADAWRPVAAHVVGQRLLYQDLLTEASTMEAVESIAVKYALPA